MEASGGEDDYDIPVEYFALSGHDLILNNEKDQQAFRKYAEARQSLGGIKFLGIFSIPIAVYMTIMALLHAKSWYFIAAIGISSVLFRHCLLFFAWYVHFKLKQNVRSPFVISSLHWIPFLKNLASVAGSFTVGLYLIARILNGPCHSLDQFHRYSCNSESKSHALPQEHMIGLMLLPIVLSTVFKTIQTRFIVLTWLVSLTCMAIAIGLSSSYQSIPALVIYIPISLAILYENHRDNLILFLVLRKQQTLLRDLKTLSEEAQNELRFMIANMAHDLKTPLSSFINGVETLSSLINELEKASPDGAHLLTPIRENIKNLFNVNNFMTMTVNRCIDYMKASKGIKLEPRLDTINLQEVLSMPLNCMRELQSRIAIIQTPIAANVCSHIITDLQWFQENLFCLTSNAVKYSSHGHITVAISLLAASDSRIIQASDKKKDSSGISPNNSQDELHHSSPGIRSASSPMSASNDYSYLDKMPTGVGKNKVQPLLSNEAKSNSFLSVASRDDVYVDIETGGEMLNTSALYGGSESVNNNHDGRQYLLIEVEDTGIGLSDEVKNSLFRPFKQAQRRAGGTGLGLYSLAKRVDALGGYYGVCNRRDGEQGSIFWFAIPYRPDEVTSRMEGARNSNRLSNKSDAASSHIVGPSNSEPTTPIISTCLDMKGVVIEPVNASEVKSEPTAKVAASPKSSEVGKLRILLVDDSVTILKMTSNLLKRHGHMVDQEENGAEALKALERSRSSGVPYDIVLLDLNMPVMDGLEAMKRLRETEKQLNGGATTTDGDDGSGSGGGKTVYHQRVFAFTANSDNETMQEAMEAGADDFISKPFSIQTFNEKFLRL